MQWGSSSTLLRGMNNNYGRSKVFTARLSSGLREKATPVPLPEIVVQQQKTRRKGNFRNGFFFRSTRYRFDNELYTDGCAYCWSICRIWKTSFVFGPGSFYSASHLRTYSTLGRLQSVCSLRVWNWIVSGMASGATRIDSPCERARQRHLHFSRIA